MARCLPLAETQGAQVENARVTKRLQFEDCALSRPTLRNATFTDTVVFRDCTLVRWRRCAAAVCGALTWAPQAAPVFENVVFEKGVKFLDCEFLVSKVRCHLSARAGGAHACLTRAARAAHASALALCCLLPLPPGSAPDSTGKALQL